MPEHSPEPWSLHEIPGTPPTFEIRDANGDRVMTMFDRELAERSVAAVNACAGFTTEQLEAIARARRGEKNGGGSS